MKILEINKFYFPKRGAEKHFLDLIRLLEEKGHEVAVFSMQHPRNLETRWSKYFVSSVGYTREYSFWQRIKGIFRGFYSLEAKRKINQLLDDFQPDIVHIHNIYHQLSPTILFEIKKRGIPIIMTVHDFKLISPNYNLHHQGKMYSRGKNKKYYQCFLDKCFKNSYFQSFAAMLEMYWHGTILRTYEKNVDLFLVPSIFVRNILNEWGFPMKNVRILPHFIFESEMIDSEKISSRQSENEFALYAGGISKEKGVETLRDIFSKSRGLRLYLAGNIEDDVDILKYRNIRYLGFLNQLMLNTYIKKSKLVISGSQLSETFGLIALEAIAKGKPFVGFRNGAYSEIIKNGFNGFIVNNKKEMVEAVKNITENKVLFNQEKIQQEAIKKFGSEKYLKIFGEILDNFKK